MASPSKLLITVAAVATACLCLVSARSLATDGGGDAPSWQSQLSDPAAVASCARKIPTRKVVLVTGSAGFVGYHCARELRRQGHGVLGLDNFNHYYPLSLKHARAESLTKAGVFTLNADLNDANALAKAMGLCKFTHILNLAAQAGVRYAKKNPNAYIQSNVAGFVSLLEAVKEQRPMPSVVYASSSSVYGTNTKSPFSEADRVNQPASLYAATKREDELLASTYNHIYGIALTGLRFFTVYGPYGRPDMAVFGFANKITINETVEIFRGPDGSELERDFTYIDDIVNGTLSAVDKIEPSGKGAPIKLYNLGNEHPETVTNLVNLLDESMGRKAVRVYRQLPNSGEVLRTHADVSLARKELGYEPKTSLKDGVKRFVAWYTQFYKNGLDSEMALYQAD